MCRKDFAPVLERYPGASLGYDSFAGFALLTSTTALAQPRPMERAASRAETGRSAAAVADDARDLRRFEQTLNAFDAAVQRRDAGGVRAALSSFVQQGRAEVNEQRRETMQAAGEANRSQREAYRDQTMKDRRDARDDRRDAVQERNELVQEERLLGELERAARAEYAWGPQPGVLIQARQAMVQFTQLARVELQRSKQELREDRRELREDRRDVRDDRRPMRR